MSTLVDSRHDLTDEEVVKDAEHALRRAEADGTEAALAGWAREWARPALAALQEQQDDLSDAEARELAQILSGGA